ncbi:MAG: hypothetical protein K2X03_00600 [Bryobacteraceae bacterium]|nr:hypothetical protein [Bryobacteraceae bacterium]
MKSTLLISVLFLTASGAFAQKYDYRLLATSKTSSMEKEMNAAAESGFVFGGVMGGESAWGGKEVVVVMTKGTKEAGGKRYLLLAASKTSTLEKEMRQAGEEGFEYKGQTVFESAFGGQEVSVILEKGGTGRRIDYKLLSTTKTSTMEKELKLAGDSGYEFLGVVVGKTAFGGREVISILQKTEK